MMVVRFKGTRTTLVRRFIDDEESIDLLANAQEAAEDPCPVCGGAVHWQKCKVVCLSCHAIVANCAND